MHTVGMVFLCNSSILHVVLRATDFRRPAWWQRFSLWTCTVSSMWLVRSVALISKWRINPINSWYQHRFHSAVWGIAHFLPCTSSSTGYRVSDCLQFAMLLETVLLWPSKHTIHQYHCCASLWNVWKFRKCTKGAWISLFSNKKSTEWKDALGLAQSWFDFSI